MDNDRWSGNYSLFGVALTALEMSVFVYGQSTMIEKFD
jgi:hypothetical protein